MRSTSESMRCIAKPWQSLEGKYSIMCPITHCTSKDLKNKEKQEYNSMIKEKISALRVMYNLLISTMKPRRNAADIID